MGTIVNLFETDCQEIQYCYDFTTHIRHAAIEKDNHLIEAVKSALPFDPLETFYWIEDQSNPGLKREDLRLDAEVIDNGHVLMEIHPGLFRSPEMIDLEAVYFAVHGKELGEGDAIKLGEIGFIWVVAFIKDGCSAKIIEDKLFISRLVPGSPPEPEREKKKRVAAAPKKRGEVRKLYIPSTDVVKYFRKEEPLLGWEDVLRAMYFVSWFDAIKLRRIFNKGDQWLADRCGISKRQVIRITERMKVRRVKVRKGMGVKGIIKLRGRGWPGEGASRWELPGNMGLVMRWRRKLRKK